MNGAGDYEYEVRVEGKEYRFFLDFYVEDINKVIEFDGKYWHDGGPRANDAKDRFREETLKSLGFNIYHVKENDYRKDKDATIQNCLEFLEEETDVNTL